MCWNPLNPVHAECWLIQSGCLSRPIESEAVGFLHKGSFLLSWPAFHIPGPLVSGKLDRASSGGPGSCWEIMISLEWGELSSLVRLLGCSSMVKCNNCAGTQSPEPRPGTLSGMAGAEQLLITHSCSFSLFKPARLQYLQSIVLDYLMRNERTLGPFFIFSNVLRRLFAEL